ncbi:alpha-ketoacid dehydrogenase subunit beta [Parageobacillus thermoglucosidasius]|uniref:alpha-ketoacid dehydrogenase subunit beta n=1 Tax=Parageobacillus thermoglucosidasius TaxID=1426 RepID=UPI000E121802|nr:alpha-ketoacid dehydrogenase subunit beta [Parageobacillus thermoglucosidasius]MED4906159.1 alpha-ketoacid dehydrogenase subunit beta [Parageobacillus thermoglucosidasius]MED4915401.1 alpha-ketoacid dehydrogenase subunit beta [Parageobacillus thermoglucosidasius]MED4944814.1 alpha-ketoacid dehydrogenase subunit beta [Parageobacillus thermoglucosidasius]MED4983980.1 alpha-ketoacid dehydrogenase subunit beta [Parageobacillus thermoglucosidasius]RDE32608.1 alpha-ketoacid dehydrogenase subunit 
MQKTKRRLLTGNKAIAEAIRQEMERDPNVFVMGEDVGVYGGIFGATEGLFQQFGPERVMDTPISETAFIGAAIGAAAEGMRPIVELMFVDFFGVCMDQIYNHMAKIPYMSGGRVKLPIVLMTAVGGGYSDAAQHSQTLYATFAHLPGMKVVAPSTPYDLKGMMISAIRDDNPVVFMFHKTLQGLGWMDQLDASVGHVPEEAYTVPIGKAKVVREGTDITIVGIQMTTHHALEAAKKLEQHGVQAEVIDLRSLVPLDRETILQSIKKTHRLLVVDEDYLSYGMTAEIAAIAAEEGLYDLDAPVRRLAVPDVPIPYSRPLEQFVLPNADKIFHEAMKLVNE